MERTLPYNIDISYVLTECLEYLEDILCQTGHYDDPENQDGSVPKEVILTMEIKQALFQIENSKP